jgi:hypothetical protein
MNCSKTMIRVAVGLGAVWLAAYLALPELRASLSGLAPFAVALICPLSMLLMMKMMDQNTSCRAKETTLTPETVRPNKGKDIAP